MGRKAFNDNCPDCRPVALDVLTGRPLDLNHPMAIALKEVWAEIGPLHRAAFHRTTCLKRRRPLDPALCADYMNRVRIRAKALGP